MKAPTALSISVFAAIAFGVTVVLAQSDPVKLREDLMKENNEHAKVLVQMIKDQRPFDPKAVEAAFNQWADTARQIPDLFPENAKTGGDNRASPKIWENKADFNAKIAAFAKVVADNRAKAMSSLDGLKVALSAVGKSCGDCHEDYRLSQ